MKNRVKQIDYFRIARITFVYLLLLITTYILLRHEAMISISRVEWIVFLMSLVISGLLLLRSRKKDKSKIDYQLRYLIHTYWVGVSIYVFGLITIFFVVPVSLLYCFFIIVRLLVGVISGILNKKLTWW